MRRNRAFSLVELLIAMTILVIVGGVAVSALSLMFSTFRQTDDHTTARSEVEFALNELRPQFTNIGLGMPNSAASSDSFARGFTGLPFAAGMTAPVSVDAGGSRLRYAWAVPTGLRLDATNYQIESGDIVPALALPAGVTAIVTADGPNDPNSWMLFPSLKIPLYRDTSGTVKVHNGFKGTLNGHAEVHTLKIAQLYVDNGKLIQMIYGGETKILAHNIVGASFTFDRATRLLSMAIATRGNSVGDPGAGIPAILPPGMTISDTDRSYRIIVETMTWRIKN